MRHFLIVTDAWAPQVNGVVRSLSAMVEQLRRAGDTVSVIAPSDFRTVPLPSYPEIRLALAGTRAVGRRIEAIGPDFIHIATEGPLGWAARRWCLRHGRRYTTSYHTRFPEYVRARVPVPTSWSYGIVRRFHNGGAGCMVATETLRQELAGRGFERLRLWPRGIDTALFNPDAAAGFDYGMDRPVFLYAGRVAVEKNIEAFLALDLPGTKVVVGDGPARARLEKAYPAARFLGAKFGAELAAHYAAADVFVFPSRTDTFGNVMNEAIACGTPVAAYPVAGPLDAIGDTGAGVLDDDLAAAATAALAISRERCRAVALTRSWETSADIFRRNILEANGVAADEPALAAAAE